MISKGLPSTILIHGTADSAAPVADSIFWHERLQALGVPTWLITAEGKEHGFDWDHYNTVCIRLCLPLSV
jgi:acetyl esterase/lipase